MVRGRGGTLSRSQDDLSFLEDLLSSLLVVLRIVIVVGIVTIEMLFIVLFLICIMPSEEG